MALGLVLPLATRVLIVNTDLLENPEDYPQSVEELGTQNGRASAGWRGHCSVPLQPILLF